MWKVVLIFFFNDTATTEIYTLSLHDALPIFPADSCLKSASTEAWNRLFWVDLRHNPCVFPWQSRNAGREDRKSTRLNSSHSQISYAVFCLKKKKMKMKISVVMQLRLLFLSPT